MGLIYTDPTWALGPRPELGLMDSINTMLREWVNRDSDLLRTLHRGEQLFLASDYGGDHVRARFESYAFVLSSDEGIGRWMQMRHLWRQRQLPDGRRMAFKSLNDKLRQEAMGGFLQLADQLPGLLLVMLVDKSVGWLFRPKGRLDPADPTLASFAHWPASTVERMLRIAHLVSLLLAGMTRPLQDVIWFSDQDEIAANETRHREFVKAFGMISSHYLEHGLRHFRFGTTASDTGTRDLEDFVSIADLAAGAVGQVMSSYRDADIALGPQVIAPVPDRTPRKARDLGVWISLQGRALRRLVFALEPADDPAKLRLRLVNLWATSPPPA